MPGTLVQDANASNHLAGATLNAAGTTNSTAVQLDRPNDVAFVLTTSTVTGTSPTLSVVIQGSDDSTFATGVVTYGTINLTGTAANQSNISRQILAYVSQRFVRAAVTLGGTSPVYTGSTLVARQPHDRRTRTVTA